MSDMAQVPQGAPGAPARIGVNNEMDIEGLRQQGFPEHQILVALANKHPDYDFNAMLKKGFTPQQINDAFVEREAPKGVAGHAMQAGGRILSNLYGMAVAPFKDQAEAITDAYVSPSLKNIAVAAIPLAPTVLNEAKRIGGALNEAVSEMDKGRALAPDVRAVRSLTPATTPEQDQERSGHYLAALQKLGSAVPFIGGMAEKAGQDYADTGDVVNLAADVGSIPIGMVAGKAVLKRAPGVIAAAGKAPEVIKNAASAVKEGASKAGEVFNDNPNLRRAAIAIGKSRVASILGVGTGHPLVGIAIDAALDALKGSEKASERGASPEAIGAEAEPQTYTQKVFTPDEVKNLKSKGKGGGYSDQQIETYAKVIYDQKNAPRPEVPQGPVKTALPNKPSLPDPEMDRASILKRQGQLDSIAATERMKHQQSVEDLGPDHPNTQLQAARARQAQAIAETSAKKHSIEYPKKPQNMPPKADTPIPEDPTPPPPAEAEAVVSKTPLIRDAKGNWIEAIRDERGKLVPKPPSAPKAIEGPKEPPPPNVAKGGEEIVAPPDPTPPPKAGESVPEPPKAPETQSKTLPGKPELPLKPGQLPKEDYIARQKAKNAEDLAAFNQRYGAERLSEHASLVDALKNSGNHPNHSINSLAKSIAKKGDVTPEVAKSIAKALYYHEDPASLIIPDEAEPAGAPESPGEPPEPPAPTPPQPAPPAPQTPKGVTPQQEAFAHAFSDFLYDNRDAKPSAIRKSLMEHPLFGPMLSKSPPGAVDAIVEAGKANWSRIYGKDFPLANEDLVGEVTKPLPGKPSLKKTEVDAPAEAAKKVTDQVERLVETKDAKSAVEVHRRVMNALQEELVSAQKSSPFKKIEYKPQGVYGGSPHGTILVDGEPMAEVEYGTLKPPRYRDQTWDPVKLDVEREHTHPQVAPKARLAMASILSKGTIRLKIPGDGEFTIARNPEAIQATINRIKTGGPSLWKLRK